MTPDDQMTLDIQVDSHISVTSETVKMAMDILGLTDYKELVKFLEPTEDEKQIIKDALECEQIKRDWCGE